MSLTKRATRRLSLLAGSSLAAASLISAAGVGLALTPTAALAANECVPVGVDPAVNGATADTFTCSAATYATTGVTYNSAGDLTVNTSTTATMPVGTVGIDLNGTGGDDVRFNNGAVSGTTITATGRSISAATGNVAVLDVSTASGDINVVSTGAITGASTSSYGINARSTGGGSINITTVGNAAPGNNNSVSVSATGAGPAGGLAAIYARTSGGNGSITLNIGSPTTAGVVRGRERAIYAETSGAGALTMNVYRGQIGTSGTGAIAGIEAVTGTGLMTINLLNEGIVGSGGADRSISGPTALRTNAGGDAILNVGLQLNGTNWGLDSTVLAGRTTTLNVLNMADDSNRANDGRVSRIRATGAGNFVANVEGGIDQWVDFSNLTGNAEINILDDGYWNMTGNEASATPSTFGPGDDIVSTSAQGVILTGLRTTQFSFDFVSWVLDPVQVIDFGAGDDTFDHHGFLGVNGGDDQIGFSSGANPQNREGETHLIGLETFNNAGNILFGALNARSQSGVGVEDVQITDRFFDDVLSMPGTHFVGEGGTLWMDVNLNGTQANCVDRGEFGDLAAADCLRLVGGSTEGVSYVKIVDLFPGDRGRYNPDGIVVVDVSGGDSAQGHFVISPDTEGYSPNAGGILDKGLFFYAVVYDDSVQQHKLLGLPAQASLQLPVITQAGQSLWRLSTGTWLDRQADMRDDDLDGIGGGIWLRAATEFADRDLTQSVESAGVAFAFDNGFKQSSYAVTGGVDVMSGSDGDTAYVLGFTAGYGFSDFEWQASPNAAELDAWTAGLYASLISGPLYVDGIVNASRVELLTDMPALDLFPAGTLVESQFLNVGAQVEAGWRIPLMETAFVEPLASISYLRTEVDDLVFLPDDPLGIGVTAQWDDPTSLRASVGARLGMNQDYGGLRAQYSGLVRLWNEFEGETTVLLDNSGPNVSVVDDFSGQFTEFGVGVSLYGLDGAVSGFFNFGGKFGDDYKSQNASTGVRVNW